ncbi:hypothetical protein GCM10027053_15550 [Intrasporangium mesophilum]
MSSPRYRQLIRSLSGFIANTPWGADAFAPASVVLPECLRRDWRRLRRRARRAAAERRGPERAARLHEVRKAAKRTRYTAEAMIPAWGRDASRFASAVEALQTILGEQRDDLVADDRLREFAVESKPARRHLPVVALSSRDPMAFERAYGSAWRRVERKKLRRWFMTAAR